MPVSVGAGIAVAGSGRSQKAPYFPFFHYPQLIRPCAGWRTPAPFHGKKRVYSTLRIVQTCRTPISRHQSKDFLQKNILKKYPENHLEDHKEKIV